MAEAKIYPAVPINNFSKSIYGNKPPLHAYEHPDIISIKVKDLFPDIPDSIYAHDGDDLSKVADSTREALKNVDMSHIKPTDSLGIVTCEHGYLMFGGLPYIEMIKTIIEVVEERTGCHDITVKVVMYRTPREGTEVIDWYRLHEVFRKVESITSYEKGVPFETRLGTVWGLDKVFNTDKFIFAYYDDPREVYCSHYFRRIFKAFTMDTMRLETRVLYHYGFGFACGTGPVANLLPTSVYDSDFIQGKWGFCTFMRTTPNGLTKIDADNDMYAMDDRVMKDGCMWYPMMHRLLISLDNYATIADGERWPTYMHCAGIIHGVNAANYQDHYDIDDIYDVDEFFEKRLPHSRAKGLGYQIFNQTWYGLTQAPPPYDPIVVVGDEQDAEFKYDSMNMFYNNNKTKTRVNDLYEAIDFVREKQGTDCFVVYDGSYGYINCTRAAAEEFFEKAPGIEKLVKEELYPKYMKQRNLEIPDYMKKII